MKIYTIAIIPDDYLDDWLRTMKEFDTSHAGCDIKSEILEGEMPAGEVRKIMEPYFNTVITVKGEKDG
jgi:hypothetical protein